MDITYKYKKIQTYGHPGSCSYYIDKLIHKNFFNSEGSKYERYKSGDEIIIEPDILYVYVERKFRYLIKYFYDIKHIYGIPNDISFEVFYKTKYSNMWRMNSIRNNICILFKDIKMAPRAYWEHHINTWIKASKNNKNIVMISYDKTLINMNSTMKKIATYLGSDKTEFIDVKDKVGWIPQ